MYVCVWGGGHGGFLERVRNSNLEFDGGVM